jgi:hypothetical protein
LGDVAREDDPDRLGPDDAHILGMESAVIMGHTLKLNVLAPGTAPLADGREAIAVRIHHAMHTGSDSSLDRPITGSRELAFTVAPLAG